MENKEIFIPGKLLIAGEYVVLDGAKSYALKTRHGQYLSIEQRDTDLIEWEALDHEGKKWLEFTFGYDSEKLDLHTGNDDDDHLYRLIRHIIDSKASVLTSGYKIQTRLTFPISWGLGSSSSLVAGIARMFDLNPYDLLANTFGGSGYDVAVGYENSGLFFTKTPDIKNPVIELYNWNPAFKEDLYFIYLNRKQNSREAMSNYLHYKNSSSCSITDMSELTDAMIASKDRDEFAMLMRTHEKILSAVLHQPRIKEALFYDYHGEVKSLGAWGGDFCMAIGNKKTPEYFRSKGFEVIFDFETMINTES